MLKNTVAFELLLKIFKEKNLVKNSGCYDKIYKIFNETNKSKQAFVVMILRYSPGSPQMIKCLPPTHTHTV